MTANDEKTRNERRSRPSEWVWSKKLRRLRLELEQLDEASVDPNTPVGDELRVWQTEQVVEHRLKPSTIREYNRCTDLLVRLFANATVAEVDDHLVAKVLGRVPSGSVRSVHSVLSAAFHWLEYEGRCYMVEALPKRAPAMVRRERFLTDEEYEQLARGLTRARLGQWASSAFLDAIAVAVVVPMRAGEIATLRWDECDLDSRTVWLHDTKTGDRVVPLTDGAAELIRSQPRRSAVEGGVLRSSEYVFGLPTSPLSPLRVAGLSQAYKRIVRRWGHGLEDTHFHTLRHSWASKAIRDGVPMEHVRRILGHTTQYMTTRYAHLTDTTLREAVQYVEDELLRGIVRQVALPGFERWGK